MSDLTSKRRLSRSAGENRLASNYRSIAMPALAAAVPFSGNKARIETNPRRTLPGLELAGINGTD